jgi:hypothetical protein
MISLVKKLMLVGLFVVALSVQAQDTNFFPVMAWNSAPDNLVTLKKMRECGFTVAGFVAPKTLKNCRKAGLMAIVSDPRTSKYDWTKVDAHVARRNVISLVKEVGKNPAVYGYYLRDEPGADFFPGLEKVASVLREKAPGKWAYVNLFPNYATSGQLGTETYPQYLQKFCDICRPTTLSYDHYALNEDGSLGGAYWKNLEQMRAAGLSNSLPFWNIIQGMGLLAFRVPDAADFRFQVYSSLAYGARGIAYFQYFASAQLNWRMSAIDEFGNQTATWSDMQNVNLQIAALAPTLLQLISDDVYHFKNIPDGCHGSTDKDLISKMDDGDFMAGDFTHRDGSRYVLVMNKNLSRSAYCDPHFRTAPKRLQVVSPFSGKLREFGGENGWLAPGQGALIKVE